MTILTILSGALYSWGQKGYGFLLMALICFISILVLFIQKDSYKNAK